MKKRFISLVISIMILMTCAMTPLSAGAVSSSNDFSQNFDEVTAKTYTDISELQTATGLVFGDSAAAATLAVVTDGSSGNYLSITPTAGVNVDYSLPNEITKGDLTISMKYKNTGTSNANNYLGFPDAAAATDAYTPIRKFADSFESTSMCPSLFAKPTKGSNDWYHLKAVYSRTAASESWIVKLYDMVPATPVLLAMTMLGAEQYPSITTVRLFRTYNIYSSSELIDDLSVTYSETAQEALPQNFSQNFNTASAQAYTAETLKSTTGLTASDNTGAASLAVEGTGSDKYLSVTAGTNTGINIDYTLSAPIAKGELTIAVSYFVPEGKTAGANHVLAFPKVDGSGGSDAASLLQDMVGTWQAGSLGLSLQKTPTKGSGDRYHFRATFSRETTTEDWNVRVYDEAATNGHLLASGTLPASDYSSIATLRLLRIYQYGGDAAAIDDIQVTYSKNIVLPQNFSQNFNTASAQTYTAETLKSTTGLTASDNIGAATLAVEGIGSDKYLSVTAGTNTGINIDYTLSAAILKGKLTVSMSYFVPEGKTAGANHVLAFPKVDGSGGSDAASLLQDMVGTWQAGSLGLSLQKTPSKSSSDDRYHFRAVYSRETVADDWNVTVYDDSVENGKLIMQGTLSATDYPVIESLRLLRIYQYGGDSAAIDDISVSYSKDVNDDEKGLTFSVTEKVLTENSASVTIQTKNSEATPASFDLVLAAYSSENGPLVKTSILANQQTATGGATNKVTIALDEFTPQDSYVYKVFFLKSLNNLQPLRAAEVLSSGDFR